uniref:Craniofacial development protein 2 n=3 Tax=Cacopsylla melanoneura TaxID=428564 RepID=A0A8D8LZ42_9HEMI
MTTINQASDVTVLNRPHALAGNQRMLVDSHVASCVKYANVGNSNRKENKLNNSLKMGTWNVKGLNEAGKLENVLNEIKNLGLDLCGISETFWKESSDIITSLPTGEKYRIIYSGQEEISRKGVAIVVNHNLINQITSVHIVSERVMAVKIETKPKNMFIIQCYAPTLDSDDEIKEQFYSEVRETIKKKQSQDVLILMGDFNSKVGSQKIDDIIGPYGLGDKNSAGDDLIAFCHENNLFLANTWFQQKESARHTWTSPGQNIKNQIDFIGVSKRFRNGVINCKARPGADCGSDHNPVVMTIKIKLKKLDKKKTTEKWDLEKIKSQAVKYTFSETFSRKIEDRYNGRTYDWEDLPNNWNNFKETILDTAKEVVGTLKSKAKKQWMTVEILQLMEERKKYKQYNRDSDRVKYRDLHRKIQRLCRQKREEYLNEECAEAERLEKVNSAKFHQKVKSLTDTKKKVSHSLLDSEGNEIFDANQMLARWKEYCQELYNDVRPELTPIQVEENEIPQITHESVRTAISKLSNNKSCGADNIPIEFVKLLTEDGITLITDMFNIIYRTGQIPEDFITSTFITLPKVSKAKNCSDFRTISLISHLSKILLQIMKNRINPIIEEHLSETQMGFRKEQGCRDAISTLRILIEKNIDKDKDIHLAFIDYKKAFDNVNHAKLIEILEKINIPKADIRLIQTLYWNQKGSVKTSSGTSESFSIQKGVRQGCLISPSLFNIYAEQIIEEALSNERYGVQINNRLINNLRYADDLVLLSSTKSGLITLLNKLFESSQKYSMQINIKKSKYMHISKQGRTRPVNIPINGEILEGVTKYNYLGSVIANDGKCIHEIINRVAIAKRAFWKNKEIMRRNISIKTNLKKDENRPLNIICHIVHINFNFNSLRSQNRTFLSKI